MENIIDTLNSQQKEALLCLDGAVLVSAGAGSGKTRLLTSRISYLISEKGVLPYNILAITFTNKAAREMKERVENMIPDGRAVWISTIHSMCARILRDHIEELGMQFNKRFSIYTAEDSEKEVKQILTDKGYQGNTLDSMKKSVCYHLSNWKNSGILLEAYSQEYACVHDIKQIISTIKIYAANLKRNNALDFDDLLLYTEQLLRTNDAVRHAYADRFKYVLVDEFQDTNTIQLHLIKLLSSTHKNVFVVGDEDQCIYGWRGANISNIRNFTNEFENCHIFKLEQNYRSTKRIINLANKLIENNEQRIPKKLFTENQEGAPVIYRSLNTDRDEAEFVAQTIYRLHQSGMEYGNMAILMRLNALSRNFEQKLLGYNIPHCIYGGFKFYDRLEVKNTLAYLRLINNPNDSASFLKVINFPRRGIGDTTLDRLKQFALEQNKSLIDACEIIDICTELNNAAKTKLFEFHNLFKDISCYANNHKVSELIDYVVEKTNIKSFYAEKTEENINRLMNIASLQRSAAEFEDGAVDPSLNAYLESVTLVSDIDTMQEGNNAVTIATVHAVKGLEFKVVFIVGMEQKVFPIIREDTIEEEERRLCYVAITRAREQLFITNAKKRHLYDKQEDTIPSMFLKELDLVSPITFDGMASAQRHRNYGVNTADDENVEDYRSARPDFVKYAGGKTISQMNRATKSYSFASVNQNKTEKVGFEVGKRVYHSNYGEGTIINVQGQGMNKMVFVQFDSIGTKQLLLEFAPLQLL